MERKNIETFSGTCWVARNQRAILAVPMMNMMTELVIAQFTRIPGNIFRLQGPEEEEPKNEGKEDGNGRGFGGRENPRHDPAEDDDREDEGGHGFPAALRESAERSAVFSFRG